MNQQAHTTKRNGKKFQERGLTMLLLCAAAGICLGAGSLFAADRGTQVPLRTVPPPPTPATHDFGITVSNLRAYGPDQSRTIAFDVTFTHVGKGLFYGTIHWTWTMDYTMLGVRDGQPRMYYYKYAYDNNAAAPAPSGSWSKTVTVTFNPDYRDTNVMGNTLHLLGASVNAQITSVSGPTGAAVIDTNPSNDKSGQTVSWPFQRSWLED